MRRRTVEVPENFELLEEKDSGHNVIRCTLHVKNEKDGKMVQCGYIIGNCSHPKAHVCFPG